MKALWFLILLPAMSFAQDYKRTDWRHWSDFDGDCQNTRHEVLISASHSPVSFSSEHWCVVVSGLWVDPYTGLTVTVARELDVDHIIPLKYAHDHGAAYWTSLEKKLFANDPDNLLPVQVAANRKKGVKGPSQFMPVESFRCEYARRWKLLSNKYELSLHREDVQAIRNILLECEAN